MVVTATRGVSGTVSSDLDGTPCSIYFTFQFVDRIPSLTSQQTVNAVGKCYFRMLISPTPPYRTVEWTLQFHTVEVSQVPFMDKHNSYVPVVIGPYEASTG